MLTDVARGMVAPAGRLVADAVRLGARTGQAVATPVVRAIGSVAAPVARRAGTVAAPVVRTVTRPVLSRLHSLQTAPEPEPAAEPHVARIPTAPGAPSPAAAHAAAVTALAEANVDTQVIDPADLPVDNWDGLTPAAVRQRIRALGEDDLVRLLAYERAHAHRPAVVLALENRLAKLPRG